VIYAISQHKYIFIIRIFSLYDRKIPLIPFIRYGYRRKSVANNENSVWPVTSIRHWSGEIFQLLQLWEKACIAKSPLMKAGERQASLNHDPMPTPKDRRAPHY
jgi:hypothetical protein